jgi:hypothetical protein
VSFNAPIFLVYITLKSKSIDKYWKGKQMLQIIKQAPLALIKYLPLAIVSWLMTLITYVVSPWLSLWSVVANISELPKPFNYFYTQNDSLDGGQHQLGYEKGVKGLKLWWQRTRWICRNPAYRFGAEILGFLDEGYKVVWEGNKTDFLNDNGDVVTIMEAANGKRYFSYRAHFALGSKHYIKIWLGWNTSAYGGVWHQLKSLPFSVKSN